MINILVDVTVKLIRFVMVLVLVVQVLHVVQIINVKLRKIFQKYWSHVILLLKDVKNFIIVTINQIILLKVVHELTLINVIV